MWVSVVAGLGGVVFLFVLLLCVPVDLDFQVDVRGMHSRARVRLAWMFHAVGWDLRKRELKPARVRRVVRARRAVRNWRRTGRQVLGVVRTPGLLRQVKCFFGDAFRSLKVRDLAVDLRMGLEDPFDTGMLFAAVGPLVVFINALFSQPVIVQPSFQGEYILEGYCRGVVRLLPVVLVGACLRLAFSGPVLRAARSSLGTAWKERKR